MPIPESSPRRAGVLMHITSLPGPGPIGTIGAQARRFVDFLRESRQSVWQVLPLTPPAAFHSPYASYSVFAGNPLLIDLEALEAEGLLPAGSAAALPAGERGKADFAAAEKHIMPLLRKAFRTGWERAGEELAAFRRQHAFWLDEYALYMAIRTKQGDISYLDWPQLLSIREESSIVTARRQLAEQIDFWIYVQYLFFTQWQALKRYANDRGVSIIGDMPIYTAEGSADVWSNSAVFQLDSRHRPTHVAGVPPDAFSDNGQRWGNPLYNWEHLAGTGYEWWIQRLRVASLLYDEIRIDHFRALDEYYAIPVECRTAKEGEWRKGPGMDFIRAIRGALPGCSLIAEDLGVLTDGVRDLLRESGLPGMRVLLFAFDPWAESEYLPHNHVPDCVAYIGTHDNDTAYGWIKEGNPDEVRFAADYLQLTTREGYHWGLIRGLFGSVAATAIVQMQDLLGLDNDARMNLPGTVGGNWCWRLYEGPLTRQLIQKLGAVTARYGRQSRGAF